MNKTHVCPEDGRKFATKAALAQHRSTSHASAPGPRTTKRTKSRGGAGSSLAIRRAAGVDMVGTFQVAANRTIGTKVQEVVLCPQNLAYSRFAQEASLYTRWRPKRFKIQITGAGAYTTFGAVLAAWTADPTVQLGTGSSTLQQVGAMKPQAVVKLNETKTMTLPTETARKWYHTTGGLDESAHGSLHFVVAASTGGYSGSVTYSIHIDWEIELEGMTLPPLWQSSGGSRITPDAGWERVFTTSDGAFDAEVLTLKCHPGGEMTHFSAAKMGVVYKPASGTVVPYVDGAGKVQNVSYFSKVQNYAVPGLLCFATWDDADAYSRSGDLGKVLKYHAAGAWATPDIVTFVDAPAKATLRERELESRVVELESQLKGFRLQEAMSSSPPNVAPKPQ